MAKNILFDEECIKKLYTGATKLADAVKVTLGPCGRLVMFENNGKPVLSKDGVTVAKEAADLEDPVENMGAKFVYEVASKTNAVAGDNTTTSTILAHAILKEGVRALSAGCKPVDLKKGIDAATKNIVDALIKMSKPVDTTEEITNVATISANNDPEIGSILAEAIDKVGKDGVITVEESKSMETSVKTTEGLQFDEGYINNYFVTNRDRMTAEFDNSYVLVTDKKITSIQQILQLLEKVGGSNPLTIICDECDGDALGTLILNNIRGSLKVLVVKAPSYGENRKNMLEDIAVLTGANLISDDKGNTLESAELTDLGRAKIKSTKTNTTITASENDKVKARIEEIKSQIDSTEDEHQKKKLQTRLARLTNKVAVVCVGAVTETEMKEKKYRIEDTIAATKAALEEGIISGGGVALVNAVMEVGKAEPKSTGPDFERGYDIVLDAVSAPMKQIAENAGVNGEVVFNEIVRKNEEGYGYNAKTGEYGDMMKLGIIDTTKAMRNALLNAASIAGMMLTTSCAITKIPKKEEPQIVTSPVGPLAY